MYKRKYLKIFQNISRRNFQNFVNRICEMNFFNVEWENCLKFTFNDIPSICEKWTKKNKEILLFYWNENL